MKRDVSTSTIGRDEARKPLMAAYMFQRRVLFGCSVLIVLSLIIWIVAIATDHWTIVSGGDGIFIPETRRFFLSSHAGLWKQCRHTKTPIAQSNANVVRNFTSFAYASAAATNSGKVNASKLDFIREFKDLDVQTPMANFTEEAKKRMFAHWVRNDLREFETFKSSFTNIVLNKIRDNIVARNAKPIAIDPRNVSGIRAANIFGSALQEIVVNGTSYFLILPEPAQIAIFSKWSEKPYVPFLLKAYVRDLGIPTYVINQDRVILQLVPPLPPKKGNKVVGFDYIANTRCSYIDMFSRTNNMRTDPAFDDELMDYIRTQASFACMTVFVMTLGAIFSFYTFMNPRYTFKRLAGGIHLVSAATALVVVQVLYKAAEYIKNSKLFYYYPDGAILKYGYGVYFAWIVFVANIIAGLMFFWYSGKKKGAKAPNDEVAMADEPTIMGR